MSAAAPGRNVVLVVLDSARADAFGDDTPNINALADAGIRFERAIAPAGWTLPSHVSMFSGLAPSEHKAVALGKGRDADRTNALKAVGTLSRDQQLLAQKASGNGIATLSASANPWLGPISGLDAGFKTKDFFGFLGERARPRTKKPRNPTRLDHAVGIARAMARHASWIRAQRDKGARRVLDTFESFFNEHRGERFFAFTNLIESHEPHVPPPAVNNRSPWHPSRIGETFNLILQPGEIRVRRMRNHNWGIKDLPQKLIDRWARAYRAEIRYLDSWIGDLMQTLRATGVADDTVVIVTGDHGESFGERGVVGHGMSIGEAAANVPLAMWGPNLDAQVVVGPVGLDRIAATVMQLLTGNEETESLLAGSSLGRASFEIEDPVHTLRPPAGAPRVSRGPGAAFYDGDLKLGVDPLVGRVLYDLSTDPGELVDLSAEREPTKWQVEAEAKWAARTKTIESG
jgi:arylsulfatase A-like enzyme